MDNKLCVSTVVNRLYQKYIPMFLYFCLKSYPMYGIKLFLTEKIDEKYRDIINKLRELGTIELVENYGKEFPKNIHHELKTLRWLLEAKFFDAYDYMYIGDIDIIICKEKESLLDQHLKHCIDINLPYSNSVRPNSERLSGLHFVKKNEYYEKVNDVMQKYRILLKNSVLRDAKNEETLYKIVKESGFLLPNGWFRPHHGLHLHLWRKKKSPLIDGVLREVGKNTYEGYYEFYKSLKKDLLFKEVYDVEKLVELSNMEEYFEG